MRAITIDPVSKTIARQGIQYPSVSTKGCKELGGGIVLIYEFEGEGLYTLEGEVYRGVGYILGTDSADEFVTPELSVEEAQGMVCWVSLEEHERKPQLQWADCIKEGLVTYNEAQKIIEALGNGWRMPTRQEQESCLDLTRSDPAVDPSKYPHLEAEWYWSSTPYAESSQCVWGVDFLYGDVSLLNATYPNARVRAVKEV